MHRDQVHRLVDGVLAPDGADQGRGRGRAGEEGGVPAVRDALVMKIRIILIRHDHHLEICTIETKRKDQHASNLQRLLRARRETDKARRRRELTKRSSKHDVPLDLCLSVLHLLEQPRVSDDARGIADLLTRLVESGDDSDDRPLGHVCELRDLLERLKRGEGTSKGGEVSSLLSQDDTRQGRGRESETTTDHPLRPLVHRLRQPELERHRKVIMRHLRSVLHPPNLLCDVEDDAFAFLEPGWEVRLDVGFLLEDKAREEGDDLFGRVVGEDVFEDELGEDELVGGVDLWRRLGQRRGERVGSARREREADE